jgi:predicted DNA-binding transcriptional regulator YafY
MNRVDRLFGILTLLQSKKYVSAERIAESYNISVRTVYRDIKALCEQGIPVSFEQNKGYFVVHGYFLPPVSFTTEEAGALMLMESVLAGFADKSIRTHYATALSKVKAVMRTSQKEKMEILQDNMKWQLPECFQHDYEYLSAIQNAIVAKHLIHIGYKNQQEQLSERTIEPVGLVFYAFSWHLMAWCHLRKEYRDFKVSRICSLKCNGEAFTKTEHMPLADFMKQLPVNY